MNDLNDNINLTRLMFAHVNTMSAKLLHHSRIYLVSTTIEVFQLHPHVAGSTGFQSNLGSGKLIKTFSTNVYTRILRLYLMLFPSYM